ncbi:MAG: hypothetical protein IKS19_00310 [Clostridia bacterium]|nr:hypothetical protein [Clostridia bacterium]
MKIKRIARSLIGGFAGMIVFLSVLTGTTAVTGGQPEPKNDFGIVSERIISSSASQFGYSDYTVPGQKSSAVSDGSIQLYSIAQDGSGSFDYPAKYDSREKGLVTSAKRQGNSDSCWAFASSSCMETSVLNQGVACGEVDFSEAHLVYFTFNGIDTQTDSPTYGDGAESSNPFNQGGNWLRAAAAYSQWIGPQMEEYSAFDPSDPDSVSLADYTKKESYAHLRNIINIDETDHNAVKQAVIDYGAVSVAYNNDTALYSKGNGPKCYYRGISDGLPANHGVVLIGWDDDFDRSNFNASARPSKNGAWLIKNSWGDSWGEEGCFWISYEEPSLKSFYCFEADDISRYDNCYLYDGAGFDMTASFPDSRSIRMANIFSSNSKETLKAVSFYTLQDNLNYRIEIYTGVSGNPDTGRLSSSGSGSLKKHGYHTIDLADVVNLPAAQRFSVIVTLTSTDYEVLAPVEGESQGNFHHGSRPGQSFLSVPGSGYWADCSSAGLNNLCIKAFTVGADRSGLTQTVGLPETLNGSDYSVFSWNRLQAQLQYARQLLEKNDVCSQEMINCDARLKCLLDSLNPSSIEISSAVQLNGLSEMIKSGDDLSGVNISLTCDIDMSDLHDYRPIGSSERPFNGTFDGRGHSITGLTFYDGSADACGLFGRTGKSSIIKNIALEDCSFSSRGNIGGICMDNGGIIENCSVDCKITSLTSDRNSFAGMIAAVNSGEIIGCTASGSIGFAGKCGAIAGMSSGTIYRCAGDAIINCAGGSAGGIVGKAEGCKITACGYSGVINGTKGAGGIVGKAENCEITDCAFRGEILSADVAAGIACDANGSLIANSYSAGSVSADTAAGIVIGNSPNSSTVENCYSASALDASVCCPLAPDGIGVRHSFFLSDRPGENALSETEMKSRRFAYELNQAVQNGWSLWTRRDGENDGLPFFSDRDSAVLSKPCNVVIKMNNDIIAEYPDVEIGDVISLEALDDTEDGLFIGYSDSNGLYDTSFIVSDDAVLTAVFKKPVSLAVNDFPGCVVLDEQPDLSAASVMVFFDDGTSKNYPLKNADIDFGEMSPGQSTAYISFYGVQAQIDFLLICRGDANGDGRVDLLDGVLLSRYLSGDHPETEIYKNAVDMDKSGNVDKADFDLLCMLLAG